MNSSAAAVLDPNDPNLPLPVGMAEFDAFVERIKTKVNLPSIPDDDLRFVLANEILHSPGRLDHYPDSLFVSAIRRSAANQVASQVFQDIKVKQRAAQEAAAAAEVSKTLTSIAEATTTAPATVANVKKET